LIGYFAVAEKDKKKLVAYKERGMKIAKVGSFIGASRWFRQ